jgi:hypothetical protein
VIRALPPPWALGALAVHAQGDPHLVDGIHYRLLSDPRLGLPMRPVHVWRTNLGPHARRATGWLPDFPALRHEVTWTDSRGRALVAPFTVTPDNPVTGVLPTNGLTRAIWLRVETSGSADLRADIFRTTARGPRLLGARDTEPLSLGGSDIDGVIVTGSGVVRDLTWLDVWRLAVAWDDLSDMALPRDNRARYVDPSATDNRARALNRVRRGAPPHVGLHDDPAAADPASTSAADRDDESAKLAALAPPVGEALDALLDDLSAPQHLLTRVEQLTEGDTTVSPSATYLPIELVHTAMLEPTIARWLGFMDVDLAADFEPDPDDVVLYQLWSWWAVDPAALSRAEIVSFLPTLIGLLTDATDDDPDGPTFDESPDHLPIFALWVLAIAVGHAPPLRPAAPAIADELAPDWPATPDRLGPWLPAVPPTARRQATIPVGGLVPAAGLAFATEQSGVLAGVNERISVRRSSFDDRALRIVPAVPAGSPDPDAGRLVHRNVPADGLTARVAQCDVFGRWSDWAERDVAPKARPAPPEPVFDLWYTIADPAQGTTFPLWGSLTARVQVPPAESMAPGSHRLDRVRLSGTAGTAAFTVEADVPDPHAGELVVEIPRPAASLIALGAVVDAVTTARWIDTAGVESAESTPRVRTCVDARGPLILPDPPVMEWTARPDATGRARVKLTWAPTGAQHRFRIYASDEQRIARQVTAIVDEDAAYGAFLSQLEAAEDPPSRAQALRDHHQLFDREWFQNLTDEPIEAAGGLALSYQHELSGSLRALAVYKVVAETDAGTAADFVATPPWVWAVPERSGPPRPLLEVLTTEAGPPITVTLRMRLTGRADAATRFRLRRSAVHSDPRRMPVARDDVIVLAPGEKYCDILDDGRYTHEPTHLLQAGRLYSWTVEVQSPDLPGSTRPGAWSRPSAAVATKVLVSSTNGQVT